MTMPKNRISNLSYTPSRIPSACSALLQNVFAALDSDSEGEQESVEQTKTTERKPAFVSKTKTGECVCAKRSAVVIGVGGRIGIGSGQQWARCPLRGEALGV